MIRVTKLDGTQTVINAEQILLIEKTPDTQIVLRGGIKLLVKEKSDDVVEKVIDYKRRVMHWPPVIVNTVEQDAQPPKAAAETES